jgi:hypothetical protein
MTEITNAGDLRTAYLQTYDSFAITPGDIVESSEGRVNMRYARELLGVLVNAGLVAVSENGEGEDVWQTYPDTYDTMTREEAEAKIDAFLNDPTTNTIENPKETTMSTDTTTKTKPVTGKCTCGCGADLTGKSLYKPGHDARHAGNIGRKVAETSDESLYNDLTSDALVAKAKRITENALAKEAKKDAAAKAKAEAKANKTAKVEPEPEQGIIKVGKNEYAATRKADGTVTYFKGDEEKVASKAASATFSVE